MPHILCLETSSEICSVSLFQDGKMRANREVHEPNAHSARATQLIEEIIAETGIEPETWDAIALSKGPGSYTGLRIGAGIAKGLTYSLEIPLIGISTLEILAAACPPTDSIRIPMLDARRMEVYLAHYSLNGEICEATKACILNQDWADSLPAHAVLLGNGMPKARQAFQFDTSIRFIENLHPLAQNMGMLAANAFASGTFADPVYFEPEYIKPFYTTAKIHPGS